MTRVGGVLAKYFLPLVGFAVVAVAFSYPLIRHLADRLPGEVVGDNVSFLWNLWWTRRAGTDVFTTPLLFAPFGTDLALHTHTALQGAVAATLLRSLDVVLAQNLIILATLTLNGYAAYLLALDRTREPVAASLAGLVFGAAPYVSAHLLGHFSLISVWTLPLFTWCLLRALERQSTTWALLTGACLVATAYTDYYYTVYCLVIAAGLVVSGSGLIAVTLNRATVPARASRILVVSILVIAATTVTIWLTGGVDRTVLGIRVRATDPTNLLTAGWLLLFALAWLQFRPRLSGPGPAAASILRSHLQLLAVSMLVFVAGVFPILVHVVRLWMSGDYLAPSHFWRSGPAGVDLATLVLGPPLHPLTGAATSAVYSRLGFDRIEGMGWLGIVPAGMLIWGAIEARTRPELRRTLLGGAFFFLWSLGPWLRAGGVNLGLMLPANLFGLVPILSNARMPGRAIVVTVMAASLLTARYLAALPRRRQHMMAAVLGVILIMECVPAPYPLIALEAPPKIYDSLPAGEMGAVLELPAGLRDGFGEYGNFDDRTLWYQMHHGHPVVGGFLARISPSIASGYQELPIVRSLMRLSDERASGAEGGLDIRDAAMSREEVSASLEAASIRYVVIDRARASSALLAFVDAKLPITQIAADGERQLFRVVDGRFTTGERP